MPPKTPVTPGVPVKTSSKGAAKSGKASKAISKPKGDKKKRKGKRKESYAIYIYKVVVGYLAFLITFSRRC